jgi:CDP-paratose 2-epimerase
MGDGGTRNILITGGAGFIGSNLAHRLLGDPRAQIRIFDDLSRGGVEHNLDWLKREHGTRVEFLRGDVRDAEVLVAAANNMHEIYHLAAQVAVTTSVEDPRSDFEVNVAGTFNVLEAARRTAARTGRAPFLLFTSTNKVYGSLHDVPVLVEDTHYRACDRAFRGVAEHAMLDFHSPYGCSKGAADQYVRDYARIYNLPTVVFRMSCIAGPRQFGTEDQGWVAHFLYSTLEQRPITIYGDGFQVRDILHVHDLLDAMEAAQQARSRTAGQIYNVGGGLERSISVVEMLREIADETGIEPVLRYSGIRPGDQPLYISDTSRLTMDTGWTPRHSCRETLRSIHRFWRNHRELIAGQRHCDDAADLDRQLISQLVSQEVA